MLVAEIERGTDTTGYRQAGDSGQRDLDPTPGSLTLDFACLGVYQDLVTSVTVAICQQP